MILKSIPFLFVSILAFTTSAQVPYQPLSVEGRQWNEYTNNMWGGGWMDYYRIQGDTLVNGNSLARLVSVGKQGNYLATVAAIMEDTVQPAITFYFHRENSLLSFGDSIYLDLSLSPGDSAMYKCASDTNYYRLDSLGVFQDRLGQAHRQHWFSILTINGWRWDFSWIEGIGSPWGGVLNFFPIDCVTDVPVPELLCVSDSNGVQLYKNPLRDTCELKVGLAEQEVLRSAVFPNPASTFIDIHKLPLKEIVGFKILLGDGRIVKEFGPPFSDKLFLDDLPEGAYFLQAEFSSGQVEAVSVFIRY